VNDSQLTVNGPDGTGPGKNLKIDGSGRDHDLAATSDRAGGHHERKRSAVLTRPTPNGRNDHQRRHVVGGPQQPTGRDIRDDHLLFGRGGAPDLRETTSAGHRFGVKQGGGR